MIVGTYGAKRWDGTGNGRSKFFEGRTVEPARTNDEEGECWGVDCRCWNNSRELDACRALIVPCPMFPFMVKRGLVAGLWSMAGVGQVQTEYDFLKSNYEKHSCRSKKRRTTGCRPYSAHWLLLIKWYCNAARKKKQTKPKPPASFLHWSDQTSGLLDVWKKAPVSGYSTSFSVPISASSVWYISPTMRSPIPYKPPEG